MAKIQPKICLIILGGTIISEDDPLNTAVLTEKDVKPWLNKMPEVKLMADLETFFVVGEKEKEPKPEHWVKTAKLIAKKMDSYDGFVIIHQSDSILTAAIAFSFMLSGLKKPVVFTGSQITLPPLDEPFNQELFKRYKGLGIKANLINALHVAIQGPRQVSLIFGNKLVTAARAYKTKDLSFNLFDAPGSSILGSIDFGIRIEELTKKKEPKKQFKPMANLDSHVIALPFYPGLNNNLLTTVKETNPTGIVIQNQNPEISLIEFKRLLKPVLNIPIVIHTPLPLLEEKTDPFFIVHNMTFEATFVKLMWILGQTKERKKIAKLLTTNLAGEIIEKEKEEKK